MRRFKTPSQENKMAIQGDEKKKSIIPKLTTVCLGVLLAVFLQIGRGGVSADISCEKTQFIAEGECQTCPNNCINCSSATTCHKCNDGFFGPACEHTCPNCSTGHNVCHKVYGHCFLGCKDGTFSSAGICSPCLDHCKICDSLTNCILCDDGHWGTACKQECQGCHRGEKADGKCLPQETDASSVTTDKEVVAWRICGSISIFLNIVAGIAMFRKHLYKLMCFIIRRFYCIWLKRQITNEDSLPRQVSNEVLPRQVSNEVLPRQVSNEVLPRQVSNEVLPRHVSNEVLPRQVSNEVRIRIPPSPSMPIQYVDNLPKPVEEQTDEIGRDSDYDSDQDDERDQLYPK